MVEMFGWFLMGSVVVVLGGWIVVSLVDHRFRPNLTKRLKAVMEVRDRNKHIGAAEREIADAERDQGWVDSEIKVLDVVVKNRVQVHESESLWERWSYLAMTVFMVELDAALFLLLSSGSHLLNLSNRALAFAAVPVSVAAQLVLHLILKVPVRDAERPARTRRRAEVGTFLTGIGVIASAWLALSGRNFSDPGTIGEVAAAGIVALVALVAICGAFASWVWLTFREEQAPYRERARLQRLHDEYLRHVDILRKDLEDTKNGRPGFSAPGLMVATFFVIVALGVVPRVLPQSRSAVAAGPGLREAQPAGSYFVRSATCEFLADVSGSDNGPPLKAALDGVATNLPLIVRMLGCGTVRVTPFAADVFTTIEEVDVPSVTEPSTACSGVHAAPAPGVLGAVRRLYPAVAQDAEDKAEQACVGEQQAVSRRVAAKRDAALRAAATMLRAAGELPPAGPCTAVIQVIGRALQRSQSVISVSDFEQTCAPPGSPIAIAPDSRLIFLVIPSARSADRNTSNVLLTHMAAVQKIFRRAIVILAPEATPSFWRNLEPNGTH
jgi:hypothetical protein